jgi:uncharacterized protein
MSDEAGRRRSRWILISVAAVVVISALGWLRLRIDSSLEPLLPEKSEARQTVLFLRDSSFAAKAVLWFRLRGDGGSTADLIAAADEVEKRIDPKLIKQVIHPPAEAGALDEVLGLLDDAGELLNQDDMAAVAKATEPDALKKRMRECYLQLARPEGAFFQQIMRRDPLGVSSRVLTRLLGLTKGLGYRVEVKDGHLLSPDGRQMMLILETSTTATSMAGSEELTAHLRDLCATAPSNIEIIPISAAIHTEQNDHLMQHDINRAGIIDGVAFLLLFVVVCRDWRVAAVFLLPIVTVAVTIGLCALVYPNLSTIVIGLAATMAGSAVDYGIFVYTAVWLGSDAKADIRRIQRPLIICHLTTLGVFVSLLFSHVPAYRQLGCLTSLSLILSLLAALFVLPAFVRPGGKIMAIRNGMMLEQWGKKMVGVAIVGAVAVVVAAVIATRVKMDPDITRLDGASAAVKQNEKDFQHTWGRSDTEMAIVVVTGKTREEAEEANDRIYDAMSGHLPEGDFVSLSSFWPSEAKRRENLQRWQGFWSPQRITQVRIDLAAAAEPFGFSADAFDPFFETLKSPPQENQAKEILSSVEEQFIARSGNGDWQLLSYFDDTENNVDAVRKLLKSSGDGTVVSRRALGQAFAESAVSETRLLVGISVMFIVISLLVLTRSVVKSAIIMLPAVVGIVVMLATFVMMSLPISVVSVIAAVLVLALASDYGVFAVYAWERRETIFGQGMASMHLSSLTTLVGTAALLIAVHPALFLVGVSLTSGLAAGYLTAFLVIPGACFLLERWRGRRMA